MISASWSDKPLDPRMRCGDTSTSSHPEKHLPLDSEERANQKRNRERRREGVKQKIKELYKTENGAGFMGDMPMASSSSDDETDSQKASHLPHVTRVDPIHRGATPGVEKKRDHQRDGHGVGRKPHKGRGPKLGKISEVIEFSDSDDDNITKILNAAQRGEPLNKGNVRVQRDSDTSDNERDHHERNPKDHGRRERDSDDSRNPKDHGRRERDSDDSREPRERQRDQHNRKPTTYLLDVDTFKEDEFKNLIEDDEVVLQPGEYKSFVIIPGVNYSTKSGAGSVKLLNPIVVVGNASSSTERATQMRDIRIESHMAPALTFTGLNMKLRNCYLQSDWELDGPEGKGVGSDSSLVHIKRGSLWAKDCVFKNNSNLPRDEVTILKLEDESIMDINSSQCHVQAKGSMNNLSICHMIGDNCSGKMNKCKFLLFTPVESSSSILRGTACTGNVILKDNEVEVHAKDQAPRAFHNIDLCPESSPNILSANNLVIFFPDVSGKGNLWQGKCKLARHGSNASITSNSDISWGDNLKKGLTLANSASNATLADNIRIVSEPTMVDPSDRFVSISKKVMVPILMDLPIVSNASHVIELTNSSQLIHNIRCNNTNKIVDKTNPNAPVVMGACAINPGQRLSFCPNLASNHWQVIPNK